MGYYDVLNYLVNKRASGDESFYTVPQIIRGLRDSGNSINLVGVHCSMLEYDGCLEAKMNSDIKNWMRQFRAKTYLIEGK